MCAPDPPAPPDYSGQNAAAVQQASLSAEQLAWAKQIYAESAPDRAAASARAAKVSDAALAAMDKQQALTDEYAAYNKNTFQPLEKQIVKEATEYDTPARRAAESADVMAKVGTQFDVARGTAAREASARGVDPSSGNFAAQMGILGATEAAQKAGAGNAAAKQVETVGAAKKLDAAGLGRNLATNQATSAGIALNAGNSSVTAAQVPGAVTSQGAALMTSGYAGAQAGLAGASSTYGSIANTQASLARGQDDSGLFGALGQVGGAYAGSTAGSAALTAAFSDVNMKENIEGVDPDAALDAVVNTPVATYNYKEGTPGAKDAGTAKTAGPMAQDVKKTMGEKVAPGGKKIDLLAMNGIAMAAIQGLNKKLDRVMAAQGLPA